MASSIISRSIEMSELQADNAFNALGEAMKRNVTSQRIVSRSKAYTFSEREARRDELHAEWNALNDLRSRIGVAFCIGGF